MINVCTTAASPYTYLMLSTLCQLRTLAHSLTANAATTKFVHDFIAACLDETLTQVCQLAECLDLIAYYEL